MIIDLQSGAPEGLPQDAICVIGAGAVGLCIAVSLARRGVPVVLLEGGGQTMETDAQALQEGRSVGHPFTNIEVGRYRVLGGSTVFWGGQVLPFDRFVRDARPWLGHDAWPIADAELDPYFAKTYELLGLGEAFFDDKDVWKGIGVPFPEFGPELEVQFTRWLRTRNLALLFKKELKQFDKLITVLHANVCAFNLSEDQRSVRSVSVKSLNGKQFEFAAKSFVLANGTLEMSRLLLHPLGNGAKPAWQGSKHLGTPMIDHLDCLAGDVHILDHDAMHSVFDNIYFKGHKYYPRIRLAPEVQREQGLVDISAQFLYRTRFSEHLEYLKMFLRSIKEGAAPVSVLQLPRHLTAVAKTALPLAVRYFKDRRSFKPDDAEVSLALYCEQLPTPRSRLELGDERDALGMRRLRVNWQIDGREIKTMKYFSLRIKQQLESRKIASVALNPLLLDEDPKFIEAIHDGIHQMGAARIGRTAQDGVVDADLKVFGTDNLYLGGAAVFPSTGFANPTFTAIALALRLADHLDAKERRATVSH